tara:strand:+ start:384 stop:533 length:150 start_codon:yes stop_codon:yes gene_type:complete
MPESKKKVTKASPKVSKEVKECQEAVVYLLEEMDIVKGKLDKLMSRMGL